MFSVVHHSSTFVDNKVKQDENKKITNNRLSKMRGHEKNKKKNTALRLPERSPISVLAKPDQG